MIPARHSGMPTYWTVTSRGLPASPWGISVASPELSQRPIYVAFIQHVRHLNVVSEFNGDSVQVCGQRNWRVEIYSYPGVIIGPRRRVGHRDTEDIGDG